MAGKKSKENGTSWVAEVEKYSRQIWLAGLGAYSKVSKDGSKLFDDLVQDGEKAEKKVKGGVDKQLDGVRSSAKSAKSRVEEVRGLALGKWGELEEAFDKRLNNAISRLGVPSRLEVKQLNQKVEQLTAQLEKLTGVAAASVKPAAKAAPKPARAAAKTAVKPAVKAAKAAVKPAAKAPAKPAVKAAPKAVAKPVAKTAAAAKPAAAKPAPKKPAASKPAVKKAAPAKPAAAPTAPAAAAPASAQPAAPTPGAAPSQA